MNGAQQENRPDVKGHDHFRYNAPPPPPPSDQKLNKDIAQILKKVAQTGQRSFSMFKLKS